MRPGRGHSLRTTETRAVQLCATVALHQSGEALARVSTMTRASPEPRRARRPTTAQDPAALGSSTSSGLFPFVAVVSHGLRGVASVAVVAFVKTQA